MVSRILWIIGLLAVLALVFGAYSRSPDHGWSHWDDRHYVQTNPDIRALDGDSLTKLWTRTYVGGYTPLTMMSYAFDYAIQGPEPGGFHRTGLLLHLINTLLVVLVTRALWREAVRRRTFAASPRFSNSVALLSGLLFGLHPLQVETVCWIAERKGVLCGTFYLTALLCYLRAVRRDDDGKGLPLLTLIPTVLMMGLALLSKQVAVTLPIALVLLDVYPLKRLSLHPISFLRSRVLYEKIPFILVALAGMLRSVSAAGESVDDLSDRAWGDRLGLAAWAQSFLLTKVFVPVGLSSWYSLPFDLESWRVWLLLASGAVLTITLIAAICYRRTPGLLIAWLAWTALLLPVSGIIPWGRHATADRYAYLPMIPWLWMSSFLLMRLVWSSRPRVRSSGILLTLIVLTTFSFLTHRRVSIWENPETVARDQIETGWPQTDMPLNNLGLYYLTQDDDTRAEEHFRLALDVNDGNQRPHYNLGALLASKGEYDSAESHLRRAIEIRPHYGYALQQLCQVLIAQEDWPGLRDIVAHALEHAPDQMDWTPFELRALLETRQFRELDRRLEGEGDNVQHSPTLLRLKVDSLRYRHRVDEALALLDGLDSHPPALEGMAKALRERSRSLHQQLDRLQQEIRARGATDPRRLQLARLQLQLGRLEASAQTLQGVEDPAHQPAASFLSARIHCLNEDYDAARNALQRAGDFGKGSYSRIGDFLPLRLQDEARERRSRD